MAVGFAIIVLGQVFINTGVNIRLLPVTGIPLPFISQGGSSLISLFLGIGIMQSIIMRRQATQAHSPRLERKALRPRQYDGSRKGCVGYMAPQVPQAERVAAGDDHEGLWA